MARYATPLPVVVDLLELGADLDTRPLPDPDLKPWAPGDMPHAESVDLNEYPVELLKMKQCRSFRADLRHKLTVIIRAHGGYGHRGVEGAAKRIGVSRITLWNWLRWMTSPRTRLHFEIIDNAYAEALETLVADKLKRKRSP
jgi:hypothetical protein